MLGADYVKLPPTRFSPGTIDTPILAPLPKQAIAQIVASIPMGRMGSADEIAKVAVQYPIENPSPTGNLDMVLCAVLKVS